MGAFILREVVLEGRRRERSGGQVEGRSARRLRGAPPPVRRSFLGYFPSRAASFGLKNKRGWGPAMGSAQRWRSSRGPASSASGKQWGFPLPLGARRLTPFPLNLRKAFQHPRLSTRGGRVERGLSTGSRSTPPPPPQ